MACPPNLLRLLVLPLVMGALVACQGDGADRISTGAVTPTVAGGPRPTYTDYASARTAFSRSSKEGVLNAILKDAAWLRHSGDPAGAMQKHRDYFEFGYTAFEVVLRVRENVRPTQEAFVLTDSTGVRLEGRPQTFQGEMTLVEGRFQYTFDLAFRHSLSRDIQWIRLTRQADGESVEWTFGG